MDSKGVAGLEHIRTAAILTAISFKNGKNLARSPATELLLYASARRQIKEAIKRLGVNSRTRSWVLVSISESMDALQKSSELFASYGQEDDTAMEITPAKRKRLMILFDISPEELALAMELHGDSDTALKALVIERVALSELYR
jgi:tRNA threonylcarbamoyladenosine modification (KEOPS) complex Cgi121 subunit